MRKGLTVAELLFMIAAVAILAAALLPILAHARERAGDASCVSNINQLGRAFAMYAQDHDGLVAGNGDWCYGAQSAVGNPQFYQLLRPYVGSWQVFSCPSASAGACQNGSAAHGAVNTMIAAGLIPEGFSLGYQMNESIWNANAKPIVGNTDACHGLTDGRRLAAWKAPWATVLMADSQGLVNSPDRVGWANGCAVPCNPARRSEGNTRHNGGSNIVFLDGHVKWFSAAACVENWTWNNGRGWVIGCGRWGNGTRG